MLSPDSERDLLEQVKRLTGAKSATLSKPPYEWLRRFLHHFGLHFRRQTYIYDDETGALRYAGPVCVFCEMP